MRLLLRLLGFTFLCLICLVCFSYYTKHYTLAKAMKVNKKVLPNGFPKGASFIVMQFGEPPNAGEEIDLHGPEPENKIKQSLEKLGYSVTPSKNADYIFLYQFMEASGVYCSHPVHESEEHTNDQDFDEESFEDNFSYAFYVKVVHRNSLKEAWKGISSITSLEKDLDKEGFNNLIDAIFTSFGRKEKILLPENLQPLNDEIERVLSEKWYSFDDYSVPKKEL